MEHCSHGRTGPSLCSMLRTDPDSENYAFNGLRSAQKISGAYNHATSRNKICIIDEEVLNASVQSSPVSCADMGDGPAINDPGSSISKYILASPLHFFGLPNRENPKIKHKDLQMILRPADHGAYTMWNRGGCLHTEGSLSGPGAGKYCPSMIARLLQPSQV